MRLPTALLLLAAPALLAGCVAGTPQKQRTLDDILQDEGTSRAIVPMYLMGPDGTFTTNGLTPEPDGDTR